MSSAKTRGEPGNTQVGNPRWEGSLQTAPASNLVGIRARWRLLPAGWRVTVVIVAAVVLAGALIKLTSVLTEGSSPQGPDSSSFSPAPDGLSALSELLTRSGDHVEQLTSPLGQAEFPDGSTVVVAAPTSWQSADSTALEGVLASGGRVVVAGQPPSGLLAAILPGNSGPEWSSYELTSWTAVSSDPLVYGVTEVDSAGPGSWLTTGTTTPLLESDGMYLAVSDRAGGGTVVLLSTPSPLQNRLLGVADDAAFAIDIAGPAGTSVVFDEYDHGYGRSGSGVGGLPGSWKAGLLLALLAVIVWMLSASRRLGPPEKAERELAPPRVAYVDAIATLLSTAHSESVPTAGEPLRARARASLCRRAGVAIDASEEEIAAAAKRAGFSADLVATVLATPHTPDDLVAVGRASAELETRAGS